MPHVLESFDDLLQLGEVVKAMSIAETLPKGEQEQLAVVSMTTEGADVVCVGKDVTESMKLQQLNGEYMDGLESISQPPSPPESGTATPTLHISPCPSRLSPLIPPPNYGATKDGNVFRSAFPQDRNLDFLNLLGIRHVLCLVKTEPTAAYSNWIRDRKITRHHVDIAPNKDGNVKTTWDSLCEALVIVMDSANHPLYIHCNQGRHRTGCVIACLRKVQRWPIEDIIAEYKAYAYPKARPGDIELIRAFDPGAVFDYVKKCGGFNDLPFMKRLDSAIGGIDALAEAMSERSYSESTFSSLSSGTSTVSEDGMETADTPSAHPPQLPPRMSTPGAELVMADDERSEVSRHAETIAVGVSGVMDLASDGDVITTSVTELDDAALTPPAEPCFKMLGA